MIITVACKSAAEFIETLRASTEKWTPKGEWGCPWIFRGHNRPIDRITPTAWRPGIERHRLFPLAQRMKVEEVLKSEQRAAYVRDYIGGDAEQEWRVDNLLVRRQFEWDAVRAFVELANQLGFSLPYQFRELSSQRTEILGNLVEDIVRENPCFALARHHGMPSRLLDWTTNPLTAAFFSTQGRAKGETAEVEVLAMHRTLLEHASNRVKVFSVGRSELGFLHAQDGLFIYIPDADAFFLRKGTWPDLLELLSRGWKRHDEEVIRRVTLPGEHVDELCRRLWTEGYSKAKLMPTHDNITAALEDHWLRYYQQIMKPFEQLSVGEIDSQLDLNDNAS